MFKKKKENIEEIVEETKPNLPFVLYASEYFYDNSFQFGGYISENQIVIHYAISENLPIYLYVREGQTFQINRYNNVESRHFLVSKLRPFENEIELHEIDTTENE